MSKIGTFLKSNFPPNFGVSTTFFCAKICYFTFLPSGSVLKVYGGLWWCKPTLAFNSADYCVVGHFKGKNYKFFCLRVLIWWKIMHNFWKLLNFLKCDDPPYLKKFPNWNWGTLNFRLPPPPLLGNFPKFQSFLILKAPLSITNLFLASHTFYKPYTYLLF